MIFRFFFFQMLYLAGKWDLGVPDKFFLFRKIVLQKNFGGKKIGPKLDFFLGPIMCFLMIFVGDFVSLVIFGGHFDLFLTCSWV